MENLLGDLVDTSYIINQAWNFGFTSLPLSQDGNPKQANWMQRSYEDYDGGFEPGDNVGVITGRDSKVIVIEFKARNLQLLEKWLSEKINCETPYARTHNGYQYYFKYDNNLQLMNRKVVLDHEGGKIVAKIKTDECYTIFPGSIIANIQYEWKISPEGHEYQSIPPELLATLQPKINNDKVAENSVINIDIDIDINENKTTVVVEQERAGIADLPIKIQNKYNLKLSELDIRNLVQVVFDKYPNLVNVYSYDELYNGNVVKLKRINKAMCHICKKEHDDGGAYIGAETRKGKIRLYCSHKETEPELLYVMYNQGGSNFNRLFQEHRGFAEIIIKKYREDIRVIDCKGPIYVYEDKRKLWREVTINYFTVLVPKLLNSVFDKEIGELMLNREYYTLKKEKEPNKTRHTESLKYIENTLKNINEIRGKLNHLGYCTSIAKWVCFTLANADNGRVFDDCPGFLPVSSFQVINLRTGEVIARLREHYFTYEIPIDYVKGKRHDFLEKFISEIMLEDKIPPQQRMKVNFLQRLLGYAITGECREQIMAVLSGEGSNGKSTLAKLLRTCMPAIVKSAHKTIIMKRNNTGAANPELHMLRGCRIALVSETQEHEFIDEDIFKRMTGGDEIQSRNLFMNTVTWTPTFVPFMITNHKPKCSGQYATVRRILIFEFLAHFVDNPTKPNEKKIDKSLESMWTDKDIKEAFLVWIVEGAIKYYKEGLNPPEEILKATEEYKKNMDAFKVFLEEEVDPNSKPDDRESANALFNRFLERCKADGLEKMTQTAFGRRLGKIYEGITSNGKYYLGIKLIPKDIGVSPISLLTLVENNQPLKVESTQQSMPSGSNVLSF
jgi:P4 family phage/plasmid primase-like protien